MSYIIRWIPYDHEELEALEALLRNGPAHLMPEDDMNKLNDLRQQREQNPGWEDDLHLLDLAECERLAKAVQKRIERLRPSPADHFQGFSLSGKTLAELADEGLIGDRNASATKSTASGSDGELMPACCPACGAPRMAYMPGARAPLTCLVCGWNGCIEDCLRGQTNNPKAPGSEGAC